MLLQIPLRQPSIATRFQRAMLVSWLMRWWTHHIRGYSLTLLEVTASAFSERPNIVSSYGKRIASSFEGRRSPPPSQQTPAPASPPSPVKCQATPPPTPAKCQATPPPPSPPQRQTSTPPPSPAQPQATTSPAQLQATPPRPTQPRQPSPPPQQSQKRHPAAMVHSGTSRGHSTGSTGGGKRYKYGPSLTPLP